jgi:putative transposase
MGVTIQFESHRHELAAIFELEHDSSVIEYYDQPPLNQTELYGK